MISDKALIRIKSLEKGNNVLGRLAILQYEFGDVVRDIWYGIRFPDEKEAHNARLKSDLSDLIIQLRMLVIELGLSWNELEDIGYNRLLERYKEFENRGWADVR